MGSGRRHVHQSASTWQQPLPNAASPERHALLARVTEHALGSGRASVRIGIDGLSAAGKTSFGHELAEAVSHTGQTVLRASLDDFKKPWRDRHLYDRESGEGYYRNAFDYSAVRRLLLEPFSAEGPSSSALCSIDPLTQVDHSDVITLSPSEAVLIVDGVFAFRPEINGFWDLRIWLDVDPELSVERGAERDQVWAGSDAEAVHRARYLVAEQLYIEEVDPVSLADLVIDNSVFTRPRLVRIR